MPPVSVHLALGAVAVVLVARHFRDMDDRRAVGLGIMAGAVVPDADLLASSLAFLVTGDVDAGKFIHRSVTHSVLVLAAVAAAGLALARTRRREWGVALAAGAASALVVHVVPDLFYLVGVKLLAPVSFEAFHYGPLRLDRFTDAQNNVINGVDFVTESLAWAWVAWIAAQYDTDNRFTHWLPPLALLNLIVFIGITTAFAAEQSYDAFLVTLYVPGFFALIVSTLLVPFAARDTWRALGDGPVPRDEA